MPFYRVTLIYKSGSRGWTEDYYRQASSAREASDVGGVDGLRPWLWFRSESTVLQAIRAQEEQGLKRIFLRLCWFAGNSRFRSPDTPGIAAKLRIAFEGGGSRGLEFRGLNDDLVSRDAAGRDRPGAGFTQALTDLERRMDALGFRGRRLIRNPEFTVRWYGLHPDSPDLTLVQVKETEFVPAVGSYVDFGGTTFLYELQRNRGYLVADSGPGYFAIWKPWRRMPDWTATGKKIWCRQLEYDYPRFDRMDFTGFGSHSTGPAYHPLSWSADNPWRLQISPCGRIVDFDRFARIVDMAFWQYDTSLTIPVRWYHPPIFPQPRRTFPTRVEEIPAVPYEHPFGSRTWELEGDFLPSLGERRERRRYSGRPPVLLGGLGLCGSRVAWEDGIGLDEPFRPINETTGQPCCCGPGALLPTGGGAGGGPIQPPFRVITGGATAGGDVDLSHVLAGGGAGGGSAELVQLLAGGGAGGGGVDLLHVITGGGAGGGPANDVASVPLVTTCSWCPGGAPQFWDVIWPVNVSDAFFPEIEGGVMRLPYVGPLPAGCIWSGQFFDGFYTVTLRRLNNDVNHSGLRWILYWTFTSGGIVGRWFSEIGSPCASAQELENAFPGVWDFNVPIIPGPVVIPKNAMATGGGAGGGRVELVQLAQGGGAGGGRVVVEEATNTLLTGLVGYWPLDEASGDAIDAHGANDLAENGVIDTAAGVITGARDFEAGDPDYFDHASSTDFQTGDIDIAVQAWVMLESDSGATVILGKWPGEFILYVNASKFAFNVAGQGVVADTYGPISPGVWYHVIGEHDSVNNELRITVNGVTDALSWSGGTGASSDPFQIGRLTASNYWDGLICEVAFWKRCLTTDEITLLYGGGSGLPYSSFE